MRAVRRLAPAVLAMLLAASPGHAAGPPAAAGDALSRAFGGPFELVDHTGATRTDRDFRGRYVLVTFGYTYCPDICPTNLQAMSDAIDLAGPAAERIQPLFVSVDPERDTVDVLGPYVGHFHPRLIGLTGTEAQVRLAAKAYRVHRSKVLMDGNDDYLVNHSSLTFLMGPEGNFVTLFPHGTPADKMADAIRRHVAQAASDNR